MPVISESCQSLCHLQPVLRYNKFRATKYSCHVVIYRFIHITNLYTCLLEVFTKRGTIVTLNATPAGLLASITTLITVEFSNVVNLKCLKNTLSST